jgi:hypothetical protein
MRISVNISGRIYSVKKPSTLRGDAVLTPKPILNASRFLLTKPGVVVSESSSQNPWEIIPPLIAAGLRIGSVRNAPWYE